MRRLSFCLVFIICCLYPPADCAESYLKTRSPSKFPSAPDSSSFIKWRRPGNIIGDDLVLLSPVAVGNEPLLPCVSCEIFREEPYPVDRLKENDQEYLKYIENKKYPGGRSALSQRIIRKLSHQNFMQDSVAFLDQWLQLKGTSIWDAVRIIESTNFDGRQYISLNGLPRFYLKQRMLIPFEAFLQRFQYEDETDSVLDCECDCGSVKTTTPFAILICSFLKPAYLNDPSVDPFFKILVQTQSKAFESFEWLFFDAWIRGGKPAWRYLKFYFDYSSSPTKSYSLVCLLTSPDYSGPLTYGLMKFIVSIESFDPNVRVPFAHCGTDGTELTPFLHIVVLDSKYSASFLPPLLTCKSLDTSIPTGKVILSFKACEIVYVNEPIIYLAGALFNGWALILLATHGRIRLTLQSSDLLSFLFIHFVKLVWLTFCTLASQIRSNYCKN
jgi:hypothetical protein